MEKNKTLSQVNQIKQIVLRYLITFTVIAIAMGLRIWPLGSLELRIPWVTFYPAVMAAALHGGFISGILGTILSATVVVLWSPTDLPFIDDPGDWLGLVVFIVNGTLISLMSGAMHRAKRRATKARDEAEAANQANSIFLANMSHELRTPLNAILGFTNLLRKTQNMDEGQTKKLNIIAKSGENLLNLINNILDISKIEAGHMVIENSDVHILQLLHEIESLISIKVYEKKINFNMVLADNIPEKIVTDAGKLRQIITNLIANAVKYTEKGSISLHAKIIKTKNFQGKRIQFSVKDTGIGIKKEYQTAIFSPFEQFGTHPEATTGTGLGLAISKQYVELLGGRIWVTSTPGLGSEFLFNIPLIFSDTLNKDNSILNNNDITGLGQGQKQYRILIAEDDRDNRILLREILKPFNFSIHEAVNGKEAVQQFEEWDPDLIWMDIRMPVMNGLDASRYIKKTAKGKNTKIVALTAHALEAERLEILEAGCDEFIRKPYRDTEIYETLKKHLNIQFQYSTKKETKPEIINPRRDQLIKVSPKIIEQLHKAVVSLDQKLCHTTIDMISKENNDLGSKLRQMVDNLKYRELLTLLDNLIEEKRDEKLDSSGL